MIDPSATILVVDDQQAMRRTIAHILRSVGIKHVVQAEDGEHAWSVINRGWVDLVLLDWNMPRCPGLELLLRIRQSENYSKLAVIMVTAEADHEHLLDAISAGVDDYIVKPFAPQTLLDKIDKQLRQKSPVMPPARQA